MRRQTLIPASADAESSFESYWHGDNRELVAELKQLIKGGRARRVLYFWGDAGAGKTHLLNACCQLAHKLNKPHGYLTVGEAAPVAPDDIAPHTLTFVDDFHNAGDAWQAALFGLYEKLINADGAMVVAANAPVGALNIKLKDLESRLASGGVTRVHALGERDKLAALQSRARQKGFQLSAPVLNFILTYHRRDTASLFSLLERIDHASLAEQRKITVPFIKSLL